MTNSFQTPKIGLRLHKLQFARKLRRRMTLAEQMLWSALRRNACCGVKFKRQVAIRDFVVDFCAMSHHLVVEVDGGIHDKQQRYDAERESMLRAWGFHILRFQNEEILADLSGSLQKIAVFIGNIREKKQSTFPLFPAGRGG